MERLTGISRYGSEGQSLGSVAAGALLVAILALSGCSAHYVKAGATEQELARDRYECEAASYAAGGMAPIYAPNLGSAGWAGVQEQGAALVNAGGNLGTRAQQLRLHEMCLEARGYSRTR